MIQLQAPFTEEMIRSLKVGDGVEITGLLYTGRDAVHKHLYEGHPSPVDLKNQIIYHCGPVIVKEGAEYKVKAAGPTTSIREEPYQAKLIERFGLKGVIGKGGMGSKTLQALQKFGCCYFHAVGGAAQVLANRIDKVHRAFFAEEFGSPEAIWEMTVIRFPAVVTMDSHGRSLHEEILQLSQEALQQIISHKEH